MRAESKRTKGVGLASSAAAMIAVFVWLGGSGANRSNPVRRGEYLANHVAMCVQCHTPRLPDGSLDRSRLFRGAPIPLSSPFADQTWAASAPSITGLPGFSDEDEISLLTTGHRLAGTTPRPPMPPFRLNREDAASVVAYLRSLPAIPPEVR